MQNMYRIIDANLNRSREGLRVIEDIVRFNINNAGLSRALKKLRHDLAHSSRRDTKSLISARCSTRDVGREFNPRLEGKSKKTKSLIISNFRRIQESLRVLEEVYKATKPSKAKLFKNLRFRTYALEKKVYERI